MYCDMMNTGRFACAAALAAVALACVASVHAEVLEETFDDGKLLPDFGRRVSGGWSAEVVDGQLVLAKADGPTAGFARLDLCPYRADGDFTYTVCANRDVVDSMGILVFHSHIPSEYSDIYFNGQDKINANIGLPTFTGKSVSESATEVTMRIRRVGETLTLDYDDGSGWATVQEKTDPSLAGPVLVHAFHINESGISDAMSGWIDDLAVEAEVIESLGPDLHFDQQIDVTDLLELLGSWGSCSETKCCRADLDGDGVVAVGDLLILLAAWGSA